VNTQAVSVPPSGRPRPTIASPESLFAWPAPNVELNGRRAAWRPGQAREGPAEMAVGQRSNRETSRGCPRHRWEPGEPPNQTQHFCLHGRRLT
jgi:hypothetical protein